VAVLLARFVLILCACFSSQACWGGNSTLLLNVPRQETGIRMLSSMQHSICALTFDGCVLLVLRLLFASLFRCWMFGRRWASLVVSSSMTGCFLSS
jgi:hypothetical protein